MIKSTLFSTLAILISFSLGSTSFASESFSCSDVLAQDLGAKALKEAKSLNQLGYVSMAIETLEQSWEDGEISGHGLDYLARLHLNNNDTEKSFKIYIYMIKNSLYESIPFQRITKIHLNKYDQSKDPQSLISALDSVNTGLGKYPESVPLFILKARILNLKEEVNDALATLDLAIDLSIKNKFTAQLRKSITAKANILRKLMAVNSGNHKDAYREHLELALIHLPGHIEFEFLLAKTLFLNFNDTRGALAYLDSAMNSSYKEKYRHYFLKIKIMIKMRSYDQAADLITKARNLFPEKSDELKTLDSDLMKKIEALKRRQEEESATQY